jgi:ABC-type lipoprotein export system ATPase subunit
MTAPAPLLELQSVGKSYSAPAGSAPLEVVRQIDLTVGAGECVTVVGPSGSGKSTLLYLIGTLTPPTTGRVLLEGRDVASLDPRETARLRNRLLGFVFQNHHLLPQCSALENVLLPTLAEPSDAADAARLRERAEHLLVRMGLRDRLAHRPAELSGGERQRVAVARALINRPRLLLADEPTGSLDATSAGALGVLLADLNREEQVALIVVTHSAALARIGARRFRMIDGRLQSDAS